MLRLFAAAAVEAEGDFLHCQLAQLRQFFGRKKVFQGGGDALHRVDFSRLQALAQVFGREVDVHDLVGHRHHIVGNSFFHANSRGALDDFVQAFEVLDIERGNDVDAGLENFLDILIALRIAAAGGVGVGQFVDQRDRGVALEHFVDIHFFERHAAIFDVPVRNPLQLAELSDGFGAAVGFDKTDDDIDPLFAQPVPFL